MGLHVMCARIKKGDTIVHSRKLPTQLMLQISGYNAIDDAEDNWKSRVKKGKCSVQMDLMLNIMCQGVHIKYILCGVLVYNPVNESTADLGHYSKMNMYFNRGAWSGMDDDTVRPISSFPFMNEIPKLVDKVNLSPIIYWRDNVCAVTYIQKEYLCCQIRAKMLDKSLRSCVPYDDNKQDFELKCNSIHDTDASMSEDGADKTISSVGIISQNILKNSIVKHIKLENKGLEIIQVTKFKNSGINVKASTRYLTVLKNLKKVILQGLCFLMSYTLQLIF